MKCKHKHNEYYYKCKQEPMRAEGASGVNESAPKDFQTFLFCPLSLKKIQMKA